MTIAEEYKRDLHIERSKNELMRECLATLVRDLEHALQSLPPEKSVLDGMLKAAKDALEMNADLKKRFQVVK